MQLKKKGRKILIKKIIIIYKKRAIADQQLTLFFVLKNLVQFYNNKIPYVYQTLNFKNV